VALRVVDFGKLLTDTNEQKLSLRGVQCLSLYLALANQKLANL